MEQRLEKAVDNALDGIAPQLFLFSIILGAVLLLVGIVFMVKKSSGRKWQTTGLIFAGIGTVTIISDLIQI